MASRNLSRYPGSLAFLNSPSPIDSQWANFRLPDQAAGRKQEMKQKKEVAADAHNMYRTTLRTIRFNANLFGLPSSIHPKVELSKIGTLGLFGGG